MYTSNWLVVSALTMMLAVGFGAFGAHGLEAVISAKQMQTWQTAVLYHLVHGLALLGLSLAAVAKPELALRGVKTGLLIGLVLFSGSLYIWVLTGWPWLVFLTPIGGVVWLVVWFSLAYQAWCLSHNQKQN